MTLPKLRQNIQLTPVMHDNTPSFLLQDSFIGNYPLFVPEPLIAWLVLLNGKHSVTDIQYYLSKQSGEIIFSRDIEAFIRMLDDHFYLDNQKYYSRVKSIQDDYKKEPFRPSIMAGSNYPEDRDQLVTYLDELFQRNQKDDSIPLSLPEQVKGIVVPHIDIQRGQANYVQIYSILKRYPPAKTYIILGVNHRFHTRNPFIFTDRGYQTPLGKIPLAENVFSELRQMSWNIIEDEIAHRDEHSVEFPILFLKYVYPDAEINMIPIICNLYDFKDHRIMEFIKRLKSLIANSGQEIALICSVDFSHIGPQFGWNRVVNQDDLEQIRKEDLHTLNLMAENNPDAFLEDINKDSNKRNIDAVGAGYVFMKILEGRKGTLVDYHQAFSPKNTVTFASLIY